MRVGKIVTAEKASKMVPKNQTSMQPKVPTFRPVNNKRFAREVIDPCDATKFHVDNTVEIAFECPLEDYSGESWHDGSDPATLASVRYDDGTGWGGEVTMNLEEPLEFRGYLRWNS